MSARLRWTARNLSRLLLPGDWVLLAIDAPASKGSKNADYEEVGTVSYGPEPSLTLAADRKMTDYSLESVVHAVLSPDSLSADSVLPAPRESCYHPGPGDDLNVFLKQRGRFSCSVVKRMPHALVALETTHDTDKGGSPASITLQLLPLKDIGVYYNATPSRTRSKSFADSLMENRRTLQRVSDFSSAPALPEL